METAINQHIKPKATPPNPPSDNFYTSQVGAIAATFLAAVKGHEYRGVGGSGDGHYAQLQAEEAKLGNDAATEIERIWVTNLSTEEDLITEVEDKKHEIYQRLYAAWDPEPTTNWPFGDPIYLYYPTSGVWLIYNIPRTF